jgi:WhiB family redox-sensing transcriptional regulator
MGFFVNPKGLRDFDWHDHAECAKPENKKISKFFFSSVPSEKYEARNLCFSCPVRKECLKWALEHKEIWGVWGGKDESEIRRALSVSHTGQEVRRQRFPNCPCCGARPSKLSVIIADSPEGGRWATMKLVTCAECEFTWRSRTSANAVDAYHASKKSKSKASSPADHHDHGHGDGHLET